MTVLDTDGELLYPAEALWAVSGPASFLRILRSPLSELLAGAAALAGADFPPLSGLLMVMGFADLPDV